MATRQYIGARYVPRFTGVYDPTAIYEALDVVDNGSGTSYIAKVTVPAGTSLTDTDYFAIYGSPNGSILNLQNRMTAAESDISTLQTDTTRIKTITDKIVTPEMYGATGDGVTDDSTAFQDMFNAISSGTLIVLTAEKYIIDSNITIGSNCNFCRISGITRGEYAPSIKTALTTGDLFTVNASGLTLSNFIIVGTGASIGVTLLNFDADNSTLNGNVDAVLINMGLSAASKLLASKGRNVRIEDSLLSTANVALTFDPCTNITSESRGFDILNNRFHSVNAAVVYNVDAPLTDRNKNCVIKSNFLDSTGTLFSGKGGFVVIENNTLQQFNRGSNMIYLAAHTGSTQYDYNVIKGNTLMGIDTGSSSGIICAGDNNIITDNTIMNVKTNGIQITAAATGIVKNNTLSHCAMDSGYTIYFVGGASGIADGNVMTNLTASRGLYIGDATQGVNYTL